MFLLRAFRENENLLPSVEQVFSLSEKIINVFYEILLYNNTISYFFYTKRENSSFFCAGNKIFRSIFMKLFVWNFLLCGFTHSLLKKKSSVFTSTVKCLQIAWDDSSVCKQLKALFTCLNLARRICIQVLATVGWLVASWQLYLNGFLSKSLPFLRERKRESTSFYTLIKNSFCLGIL